MCKPTHRVFWHCLLLTQLIAILFCARVSHADTATLQALIDPPLQPTIGLRWLGADVATSIKITPQKYLWLFGDTLLGSINQQSRIFQSLVTNSIGISRCDPQHVKCQPIHKYIKKQHGVAQAFFQLQKPNLGLWPTSGSMLKHKLLVSAYVVDLNSQAGLWFHIVGTCFILIDNPLEKPTHWRYHSYPVPNTDAHLNWAVAMVQQGKWLYLFGSQQTSHDTHVVLARITINNAEEAQWHKMEYWCGGKCWRSSHLTPLAHIPGLINFSEMSLNYNAQLQWHTVAIAPFSFDVHLYSAAQLEGPWHDHGSVYSIPQRWHSSEHPNFLAYAAKLHPELAATDHELVVSYNINTLDNQSLGQELKKPDNWSLYIPQLVSLQCTDSEYTD